ncbi:hypothetical protein [Pseudoalteromonas arctica]|uniref:Uncharacterized protein n=1 Tax=Pseudoalteromonas arctica TaxID=394751 RepID=A0A7Y0DWE3_9GAMM|nr:hypothetical protein [Pseudoalteromonas arctica]NMM42823.1 hypothetical protein [Pseudoalteromonas arctica]
MEEYIYQVKNSKGENVEKSEVIIKVDGKDVPSNVLTSVEQPSELIVNFKYEDEVTGLVSSELKLVFERQISNISGKPQEKSLFTIQSGSGYKVNIEIVTDIIYAIDKVYSTRTKEDYLPLIACSIRAIFEISSDKLFKTHKNIFPKFNEQKFTSSAKREVRDGLLKNVAHVICLVKKNNKLKT